MSFRRSQETGPESSRWRCEQRAALSRLGVPDEIIGSDSRWRYVLLHGDDELESGWNPTWLTPVQASELLALLSRELADATGYELLTVLQKRTSDQE